MVFKILRVSLERTIWRGRKDVHFEWVERLRDKKEQLWYLLIPLNVVLLLVILYVSFKTFTHTQEEKPQELEQLIEQSMEDSSKINGQESGEKQVEQQILYIDIKGAVQTPGVYQVQERTRVMDAVQMAGGLTEEADDAKVNLAMLLVDQMVIYVPKVGETPFHHWETESKETQQDVININRANKEELMRLEGIGEKKAASIIQYREENGSFQTIEEIMNISGIGEKTFEKFKEKISTEN